MACGSRPNKEDDKEFQDLSGWDTFSLERLQNTLSGHIENDEARVYNVKSTRFDEKANVIRHYGSGPNLEGGLATLCTCKRSMRHAQSSNYWKGKWILGVTSRDKTQNISGKHYILYLMKVEQAFKSHQALYKHLKQINPYALQTKNAHKNPFGDIYEPKIACVDPLDPTQYKPPHKDHDHGGNEWQFDISFRESDTERSPAPLLLGDVNNTFVWQKPMIIFKENRGPSSKKITMTQLLFDELIPIT